jgi:peptidoglycan hydrolase-like protein with peptidoglycan-binding domain
MIRLRRRSVVTAVVVAAAGGVVGAAGGYRFRGRVTAEPGRAGPRTVEVTVEDLVDFEDLKGDLGFGAAVPLRYVKAESAGTPDEAGQLLVTWLAPVGSTVDRGQAVFRIDDRPVPLLFGPLPVFRRLAVGVRGADVRQLKDNLRTMRLGGGRADETFTGATAAAVRRWQRRLGLAETGVIEPGRVVCAAGAIRVAAHTARVGDPADGEVLRYTGTTRSVLVALPAKQQRLAAPQTRVVVTLPGSGTVDGVVDRVTAAPVGEGQGAGAEPATEATVTIADQAVVAHLQGRVQVRFVVQERKRVLTVPVVALVALAEGGYGVQVADGGRTGYVAVETGRVEIRPGTLTAGTRVVVPA